MAKPRKPRKPTIPSIQPVNRVGRRSGQARDTHVLRQTRTTAPDGSVRSTGSGDGKGGYGPNRLHGSAQGQAIASARKNYGAATIRRMQEWVEAGESREPEDITKFLYFRTKTKHPNRPRTKLAGYDGKSATVRILFRYKEDRDSYDGAIYEYYDVPYNVWRMVKRNVSTGETINRTLNSFRYAKLRDPVG